MIILPYYASSHSVDPHRVHCAAVSKLLKFCVRLVQVDTYTLQGKSLPLPLKLGEYSATNIGQIAIHPFIHETWKCARDGCVIRNLVAVA